VKQGVDSMKHAEGVLLGQFVAVLNAKKDEIVRLHCELDQLKDELEAGRQRSGSPVTQNESKTRGKKRPGPSPSRILQDTDSEHASLDSEDEDRRPSSPVSRPTG
jgi:hypothetical protein